MTLTRGSGKPVKVDPTANKKSSGLSDPKLFLKNLISLNYCYIQASCRNDCSALNN